MNNVLEWLFGTDGRGFGGSGTWGLKFTADYGPYITLALLVVLGLMVWLTIRSYRREGENRPRVKYGLAVVRLVIIGLCIAALFRPAAVLSNNRVLHSAVIVLIDDSQSLTIKDRYADAKYASELGQLLNIEPGQLGDKSRMDIVKAALNREGGAVARLAQEHPIRVMKFSPSSVNGKEFDSLGVVEEMVSEDQATNKSAPVPQKFKDLVNSLQGSGYSTNLASGIRNTLQTVQGQRIAGLVVISDGRQTTEDAGNRLHHALEYAQARGIAIYSVVVGDPTPTKNLAVLGLQAPREMRKGSKVEMTAKLSHRNLDGQKVVVKLFRTPMLGGEMTTSAPASGPAATSAPAPASRPATPTLKEEWLDTGVETPVTLQAGDPTKPTARVQDVVLKIDEVPATLGNWKYKAVVQTLPDEFNKEDNQSSPVQVSIIDSMINVLLVAGDSGWEMQYLRNSIQRQPDLYRLSVWQQNAEAGVSQGASSPEMRLDKLPRQLSELVYNEQTKKGYHVIILYDPEYTKEGFDETFCKSLKDYVDQGKGGVLYIAGNKYTNDNLVMKEKALKDLQSIMPVDLAPNMTTMDLLNERQAEAWRVSLTLAGRDHQITRLGSTAEDTERVWGSAKIGGILPGIFWSHPVAKIKPLAHVLLENTNPRAAASGAREPLLAVMMYGKGPVVYLGTDDTWRWRFVEDAAYYRQFWNNLLSFLAAQKSSRVTITTGGDRFTIDKPVTIDVEAYDANFKPETVPNYTIEVWNISGNTPAKVTDLTLRQATETVQVERMEGGKKVATTETHKKEGRYTGQFAPPTVGKYEFCIADRKICQPKQIEVTMMGDEFIRTEADEELMKQLVNEKPERFMRISQVDQLADQIPVNRIISIEQKMHELWDIPLLLVMLLVLLVVEWVLRKKYNMT